MSIEYLRALLDAEPADIAFPLSLDMDAKRAADAAQIDLEALTEYRARLLAALPEERAAEGVVQSYADLSPTAGLDRDIAAAQQRVDETRDAARRVTIVLLFRQLPTRGEGSFQELAAEMASRDGGFDAVAFEEALVERSFLRCETPDGAETGWDFATATKRCSPADWHRLRVEIMRPYEEDSSIPFDPRTSGPAATS